MTWKIFTHFLLLDCSLLPWVLTKTSIPLFISIFSHFSVLHIPLSMSMQWNNLPELYAFWLTGFVLFLWLFKSLWNPCEINFIHNKNFYIKNWVILYQQIGSCIQSIAKLPVQCMHDFEYILEILYSWHQRTIDFCASVRLQNL